MNAAAVAAADFKNGFGTQFMQPFADTDALYSSYSPYNNWATKVPSPLGTKTFPWPVNPLGSVVAPNHHQNSVNCFNSTSSVAVSMNSGGMLSATGMGTSLTGTGGNAPPCPYTGATNPYSMYHRTAEPCTAMSSSIATLRLKAKQHSSGFASPYSAPSPVSRSNSAGLSACQYAGITDVWDNRIGTNLFNNPQLYTTAINSFRLKQEDDDDERLNGPNIAADDDHIHEQLDQPQQPSAHNNSNNNNNEQIWTTTTTTLKIEDTIFLGRMPALWNPRWFILNGYEFKSGERNWFTAFKLWIINEAECIIDSNQNPM